MSRVYQFKTPYYQDRLRIAKYHGGKSFIANPRIWKKDVSLFFPNIVGRTLASSDPNSIVPALTGKVTVVSISTSVWADEQTKTFTSVKVNPALEKVIAESNGKAQMAYINLEDKIERRWLLWSFLWRLRKMVPEADHERYFIVSKTLPINFRAQMGWINKEVGYVYLVDQHCKIRWVGSAFATQEERDSLVKGLTRLIDDASGAKIARGQGRVSNAVAEPAQHGRANKAGRALA
jgi:mitochondrial ATPase complex subunit ATP10